MFSREDPFPLKFWLQMTYPLLKAASFDTFCLVAPQPQEIEKEVQLHLTIKDEKSAETFHYIKTVSGKVVAHSIAFRVVSIY